MRVEAMNYSSRDCATIFVAQRRGGPSCTVERPQVSPSRRSPEASHALRASLIDAARTIVDRDGPAALTMRSVAAEAGCALGLPYKVFADRTELVAEVIAAEFVRLRDRLEAVVADAGSGTVGGNLSRWASLLLSSPAIGLAHQPDPDDHLLAAMEAAAGESGIVKALEQTAVDYLKVERRLGRVDATADPQAFGFLIAGAVHNLLASGEAYPRPSSRQLDKMLKSVARAIAPRA